jgi:hypothetical protein
VTFDYLLDKINAASFSSFPFKHLFIADFFSAEHLEAITSAPEIQLPAAANDETLFDILFSHGYKIIDFPGCVVDRQQYIEWHKKRSVSHVINTSCEGFGMTLRLTSPKSAIISELHAFLVGDKFKDAIARKFDVALDEVFPDSGIQKYLDGYEISPHPDIRRKALTYMVNINPHAEAEELDHHTHYLSLKPQYKYVQSFWEGNPDKDRCWVPWDWCETQSQQRENNSIVIFSPNNDTLHGVKASYDHLKAQRTQLYGNLWYHACKLDGMPSWEDYVVGRPPTKTTAVETLKALVPSRAKDLVKSALRGGRLESADQNVSSDRRGL